MEFARHKEVADKVIEILQTMTIPGVSYDQIYLTRFPFYTQPSIGLAVSMLNEEEGAGLNELDDIAYPVQLTRILHRLHPNDGLQDTSLWRDAVRRRFNHKRIGVSGCELVTKANFAQIEIPAQWNTWNIDASVLQVVCWCRETRTV
jgi:hypothetical protein